jgi:hypothetical protein
LVSVAPNLESRSCMEAVTPQASSHGPGFALKRVFLLAATMLAAVNVWTGAPLLALWLGSRVQGGSGLKMSTVFVMVIVLALVETLLGLALTWLNARYDAMIGRPHKARRTSPWMRSMRGEREKTARREAGVSGAERVVAIAAVGGVVAFEVWFFFFAGSSLGPA